MSDDKKNKQNQEVREEIKKEVWQEFGKEVENLVKPKKSEEFWHLDKRKQKLDYDSPLVVKAVYLMSKMQMTKKQIARRLCVGQSQFLQYCDKNPNLLHAFNAGRDDYVEDLLNVLKKEALTKNPFSGSVNTRALLFALKHLDPENRFVDKKEEVADTNITINIDSDESEL